MKNSDAEPQKWTFEEKYLVYTERSIWYNVKTTTVELLKHSNVSRASVKHRTNFHDSNIYVLLFFAYLLQG